MQKKVRILHITQATMGGLLIYFKTLLPKLNRQDFEIEVLCDDADELLPLALKQNNIKTFLISMQRRISLHDLRITYQVYKIIKKGNYDILHCHSSKAGLYVRLANIILRKPCIYTPHGYSFKMNIGRIKKKLYVIAEKWLSHFCNYIIVVANTEKKEALKYGIAKDNKFKIFTNAIEPIYPKTIKNSLPNKNIIGLIGRMSEQKNIPYLIDIAKEVTNITKEVLFIIVGDGELRKEIEEKIHALNLKDYFHITGWTNEAADYLQQFNIAVLTSQWEGMPLTLLEYMAFEKPIIATNISGITDVIENGKNGFLIPLAQPAVFSKKIIELLNNKDLSRQIAAHAYQDFTRHYTIDRLVKQHSDLYEKIIAQKNMN